MNRLIDTIVLKTFQKVIVETKKMSKSFGRVQFDYSAIESDELEIEREEIVELIHLNEDGWWIAKKGKSIGLIPGNYVVLEFTSKEGLFID